MPLAISSLQIIIPIPPIPPVITAYFPDKDILYKNQG